MSDLDERMRSSQQKREPNYEMITAPLSDKYHRKISRLSWGGNFQYPGMLEIHVPGDGNCLFHCIASAYYIPYMDAIRDDYREARNVIVQLREELADKLYEKDEHGVMWYDKISDGELRKLSEENPEFLIDNIAEDLRRPVPVSNIYNSLISELLNKDIYILHKEREDVYMTGSSYDKLYKERKSIVILAMEGHYNLVGISHGNNVNTHFSPRNSFIRHIKDRMLVLSKE